MIRISGGRYRGRQIYTPAGKAARPTTSFVRESLFSTLGILIQEARFLDLFAGSGIVGIEALSRGASEVIAVEKSSHHCQLLDKNKALLEIDSAHYRIECQDVMLWLKHNQKMASQGVQEKPFEIIFLDPPYAEENLATTVIQACFNQKLLTADGQLIWECGVKTVVQPITGAECIKTKSYGTSKLAFFTYSDSPETPPEKPLHEGS